MINGLQVVLRSTESTVITLHTHTLSLCLMSSVCVGRGTETSRKSEAHHYYWDKVLEQGRADWRSRSAVCYCEFVAHIDSGMWSRRMFCPAKLLFNWISNSRQLWWNVLNSSEKSWHHCFLSGCFVLFFGVFFVLCSLSVYYATICCERHVAV